MTQPHPTLGQGLLNPAQRRTLPAWWPLALPLLLGSAAPLPAAAQRSITVPADEPVRQATAQLQDLGAMLRPVARRDRGPTVLALATWTPPEP